MLGYLVRRVLYAVPILIGVNLLTFVLFFVVNSPDDMARMHIGVKRATPEAIERMNRLGILVDLSHCGRRTAADAIVSSRRPVAFTHTGCAALADHPRNAAVVSAATCAVVSAETCSVPMDDI